MLFVRCWRELVFEMAVYFSPFSGFFIVQGDTGSRCFLLQFCEGCKHDIKYMIAIDNNSGELELPK